MQIHLEVFAQVANSQINRQANNDESIIPLAEVSNGFPVYCCSSWDHIQLWQRAYVIFASLVARRSTDITVVV